MQNYSAVEQFVRGVAEGFTSISKLASGGIQAFASLGGVCNGLVNYFINVELIEGFFERIFGNKKGIPLTGWRKIRYYAGIL